MQNATKEKNANMWDDDGIVRDGVLEESGDAMLVMEEPKRRNNGLSDFCNSPKKSEQTNSLKQSKKQSRQASQKRLKASGDNKRSASGATMK